MSLIMGIIQSNINDIQCDLQDYCSNIYLPVHSKDMVAQMILVYYLSLQRCEPLISFVLVLKILLKPSKCLIIISDSTCNLLLASTHDD